ncbi:DUF1553 domain-containing protein [bacterium]|nr:DUF1553 domain-containing protein [bacterium]
MPNRSLACLAGVAHFLWITVSVTLSPRFLCADEALYVQQIKPLLQKRCFACHGALKSESMLRLDSAVFIGKGGSSGPAMVPGRPAESEMIRRVRVEDLAERMPPEGDPLSPDEIALLDQWIESGAQAPADDKPEPDPQEHWAFRVPTRPSLPAIADGSRNPIDPFIEEGYRSHGLKPIAVADRNVLLRRATVDLVGLLPIPDELDHFLNDDQPDAYERQIDRLLASPAHGERWARHWMDVWRYSDWYGRRSVPDVMNSYPHVWRWRDWIVRSLNEDRRYADMVVEMLAADEALPGDDEKVVATGFLVRNWFKWNYETWMKDNVEHTAKAFLGLTMNCCHCHDHKYDPVTQEEYFRFRAFFEPLELRQDRVPGLPDPGPFKKYVYAESYGPIEAGLVRVFDEKPDAPTYMFIKGDSRNRFPDKPPVLPGTPAILGNPVSTTEAVSLPAEAYYPGLKSFVRDEERSKGRAAIDAARVAWESSHQVEGGARQKRAALAEAMPIDATAIKQAEHQLLEAEYDTQWKKALLAEAESSLLWIEARIRADDARYRGMGDLAPLAARAFAAGKQVNYRRAASRVAKAEKEAMGIEENRAAGTMTPAAVDAANKELADARSALDQARLALSVEGDSYSPLSPIYPATTTGRRLALARWITSSQNPLTARVAVNHLWMRHYGKGLVDTPSNFGRSGHAPTHPALMDWLAVELVEHDWQMKHLHRLLVTSETYRLGSNPPANEHPNRAADQDNRWYWRSNPRRMEAEVVRDAILACAEELDLVMGGQEIDANLGLTSRRRSLYFSSHGEGKMVLLETFDAPDVCDGYQRSTSIRPQQALALVNSELTLSASRALTAALNREGSDGSNEENLRSFVAKSFQKILSRTPTKDETDAAMRFLSAGSSAGESLTPERKFALRASFVHALFNHHEFVTVR